MSRNKQKERLKTSQSAQSLLKQQKEDMIQKREKKGKKKGERESVRKGNGSNIYGLSRFNTDLNQRFSRKQSSNKFKQLYSSHSSRKIEEKDDIHQQLAKNTSSSHVIKHNKINPNSPFAAKFIIKTQFTEYEPLAKCQKVERRPLKKEKLRKNPLFPKVSPASHQIKWMLTQQTEDRVRIKQFKSREGFSKNKRSKKMAKLKGGRSMESTPSCMVGEDIQMIEIVDEGTFGKVFRGRSRKNGDIMAIKKVLQDSRYRNRQLQIINMVKNDFVVQLLGSYTTHEGAQEYLNIMMAYYEENLFHRINFYKQSRINKLQAKIILYQVLKGVSYLHSLGICHRDIKPQNILLRGAATVICDFGSAKILQADHSSISYICARCYRAPQLIFGAIHYTTAIDIWSAGCVVLELLKGEPLFVGETSISHLQQVMKVMGRPTEQDVLAMNAQFHIQEYKCASWRRTEWHEIFPDADHLLLDLVDRMMVYDPSKRATSCELLSHQYFDELRDKITYEHIKSQFKLKDFFNFSEEELKLRQHLKQKLIPEWYRFV